MAKGNITIKKIPKGAPKKYTSTPGSWGDNYIIEKEKRNPSELRHVSCKHCVFYDNDDGSCRKTSVIPNHEKTDFWVRCRYFLLSLDYQISDNFRDEVLTKRIKYSFEDKEFIFDPNYKKELLNSGNSWYDLPPEIVKKMSLARVEGKTRREILSGIPGNMRTTLMNEMKYRGTEDFINKSVFVLRYIGIDTDFRGKKSKLNSCLNMLWRFIVDLQFTGKYNLDNEENCKELFLDGIIKLMEKKKVFIRYKEIYH